MQKQLTVTQLNNYIGGMFEEEIILHDIVVVGEVFSINISSGRTYFVLKDGEFSLSCMCFYATNDIIVGDKINAIGRISFYKKAGKISLLAKQVSKSGQGNEHLEFIKLKEKLASEGLFDNRLPLPDVIKKICVITSGSGAVIHDILSVVRSKDVTLNIAVYDVRVQGEDSANQIAHAIKMINEFPYNTDVVVLARGGGSATDLQSFNTEIVARAVAGSSLPIVSAIGHDTDYTLCDLCASVRAGTPSIAADIVTQPISERLEYAYGLLGAIASNVSAKYDKIRYCTSHLSMLLINLSERGIKSRENRIYRAVSSAYNALNEVVNKSSERISRNAAILDRLSPLKVLARGYSKVSKENNDISSAKLLAVGDEIKIIFADGSVKAEIKE